jgi:hypothetical protein
MSLTLQDDLRTRYESAGMFAGGTADGSTFGGVSFFKPAIPAQASWLDVLVKDGFVRFDLAWGEFGTHPGSFLGQR